MCTTFRIGRLVLAVAVSAVGMGIALEAAGASKPPASVDCQSNRNNSVQDAVDAASPGDTIFVEGICAEDVVIRKDDITLSGNQAGLACDKADPSASAAATIDGTITLDGVRARLEFLRVTGAGSGVRIVNRANGRLFCNDISDNEATGVVIARASNGVLVDNTVRGNGRRSFDSPLVFFDCGLFAGDASSVYSTGNTYRNNQYCAVEIDRQSAFRNASFLPRAPGFPPDPDEKDVIIQKGGDFGNPASCRTNSSGPVALEVFNDGLVDVRNVDICGEIEVVADSSFRIDDGGGAIIGNIFNARGSLVRINDRSNLGDGRATTFDGTLICVDTSQTFSNDVQCGQTCDGTAPLASSCTP